MLLKEKYDQLTGASLSEKGAPSAAERVSRDSRKSLKKALERRRKKNAAKEKRDMPVGMVSGLGGATMPKRKRGSDDAFPSPSPSLSPSAAAAPKQSSGSNSHKRARRGSGA